MRRRRSRRRRRRRIRRRKLLLRGKVPHDRDKEGVVVANFCNPPVNIEKRTKTKCLRKVATRAKLETCRSGTNIDGMTMMNGFQLQLISVKLL